MQGTFTRNAIAVAGLTFALGIAAPTVAFAADGDAPEGESQSVLELTTQGDADTAEKLQAEDAEESDTGEPAPDETFVQLDAQKEQHSDEQVVTVGTPINQEVVANSSLVLIAQVEAESSTAPAVQPEESVTQSTEKEGSAEQADPDAKYKELNGSYVFSSALKASQVLDVKGGSDRQGTNVQIAEANGSNAQKWRIEYWQDGYYRIITNAAANQVLDVDGGKKESGANVQQYTWNKSAAQLWSIEQQKDGSYRIVSKLSAKLSYDLVLDIKGAKTANGINVQLYRWNGSAAQKFNLYEYESVGASTADIASGNYSLRVESSSSYSVDVKGGSRAAGTNVQLYAGNNSQAQRFHLEKVGDYYVITVIGSGKVLSPQNASLIPGTGNNVVQATYSASSNLQKWAIYYHDGTDGKRKGYEIVNKATGLALDISGGKTSTNGANIQTYRRNDSAAQRYALTTISALTSGIYTINSFTNASIVMDIKGASTGTANVQLYASNDSLAQRFGVEYLGTTATGVEQYRIRTASSGGWLTYSSGTVVQKGKGSDAVTADNTWNLVWNGSYFSLRSASSAAAKSVLVLDAKGGSTKSGTAIQLYKWNGTDAQHYYFTPSNLIANGNYVVASKLGTTVLDVSGGSKNSGANIQTYAPNGSTAQTFTIRATGSTTNVYTITNLNSQRAVGAAGLANGSNVSQGASNQQWIAAIADGGTIAFINAGNLNATRRASAGVGYTVNASPGLALDVKNGSRANRADVQIYAANGSSAQAWKLTHSTGWFVDGGKYYFYDADGKQSSWNSSMYETWKLIKKKSSNTQYLISVDKSRYYTNVYRWSNGVWVPYKSMLCTVGNQWSPTPNVDRLTSGKRGYYNLDEVNGNCEYWWTEILPNWEKAFHSILYRGMTMKVMDGRLGTRGSGGCVRLSYENAKWVYYNIRGGTRVYIY